MTTEPGHGHGRTGAEAANTGAKRRRERTAPQMDHVVSFAHSALFKNNLCFDKSNVNLTKTHNI